MDLDRLVLDQLRQLLLGRCLIEVLPALFVVLGQVSDFFVLALLVLLQLRRQPLEFVRLLVVCGLELGDEASRVRACRGAAHLLAQLLEFRLLLLLQHLLLRLLQRDGVLERPRRAVSRADSAQSL